MTFIPSNLLKDDIDQAEGLIQRDFWQAESQGTGRSIDLSRSIYCFLNI